MMRSVSVSSAVAAIGAKAIRPVKSPANNSLNLILVPSFFRLRKITRSLEQLAKTAQSRLTPIE
jgi:hypothetical protein